MFNTYNCDVARRVQPMMPALADRLPIVAVVVREAAVQPPVEAVVHDAVVLEARAERVTRVERERERREPRERGGGGRLVPRQLVGLLLERDKNLVTRV